MTLVNFPIDHTTDFAVDGKVEVDAVKAVECPLLLNNIWVVAGIIWVKRL